MNGYLPPGTLLPAMRTSTGFVTGLVTGGCIAAFRDEEATSSPARLRRVLRHALQAGVALTAGQHAAAAIERGELSRALLSAAAGAGGVLLIERLLRDSAQLPEKDDDEGA